MTTTLKKALSVLMAVAVFVGGLFVSFNIKDIAAEDSNFDAVYDYTSADFAEKTDVAANLENLGLYSANVVPFYVNESAGRGLAPTWAGLNARGNWNSTNEEPYVIYHVEPGSVFEAKLRRVTTGKGDVEYWANNSGGETGYKFEFTISASDSATGGWKNFEDTSSFTTSDITYTYNVPDDCQFVKITYPNKGKAYWQGALNVLGSDILRIEGVKFKKAAEGQAPNFDGVYDYTSADFADKTDVAANLENLGLYSANVVPFYVNEEAGRGLAPTWAGLNARGNWNPQNEEPYVVYRVEPGSVFEANLYRSTSIKADVEYYVNHGAGDSGYKFEFTISASDSATGGWKNFEDTSSFTTGDITYTYNVPDDCQFVKIAYPEKGKAYYAGGVRPLAGDVLRIEGVKFKKAAGGQAPNFDGVYDYTSADFADKTDVAANLDNLGLYSANVVPFYVNETAGRGLAPTWAGLNARGNWKSTNEEPYVIYHVEPGSVFEAKLYRATAGKGDVEYWANNSGGETGYKFEFTISASDSATGGWKNLEDTSSFTTGDITYTYNVPEDCQFVKITYPNKGKAYLQGSMNVLGSDILRIEGVKFKKHKVEQNAFFDYTTFNKTSDLNDEAKYGIFSFTDKNAANLVIETQNRGINPVWDQLYSSNWGQLANPYAIYRVVPGTEFEARFYISAGNGPYGKETITATTNEPFDFIMEASANGDDNWKAQVSTADFQDGNSYVTIKYNVPADCNFVKIIFPQKGAITLGGAKHALNDLAVLKSVKFVAPEDKFVGCDTVWDYMKKGPVNFFYDNDPLLSYLADKNGIAIDKFTSGKTYVAPDADYVKGTGFGKPYVTFAVEPESKFVAAIKVDREAAAALGADFKVKVYESADGTNWTENTSEVIKDLDNDIYSFETAATTKFVKFEFPHTDAVKDVEKVHEIFGLSKIGFNPDDKAYTIENPYGDYKFGETHSFLNEDKKNNFDSLALNIYDIVNAGALGFDGRNFLEYPYGKLWLKEKVDMAGFIYSVKPGTAFQVVALTARDNGSIQKIEGKLGTSWDITLEVSSDGKTWTPYNPSRILTEQHLLEKTDDRYKTEVITIPSVPADVKFVKILYPHTGDMNIVTEGASLVVGNDLIGVQQVSLTSGGAVPLAQYKPNKSKYEIALDMSEDVPDLSKVSVTGMEYSAGLKGLTPSWNYFATSGEAIRATTAATVAVKEGSAFYAEVAYRADRMRSLEKDNYYARLYFSSDRMTWTDVTEKYVKFVAGSGTMAIIHRFEIDKLPAGVKYVMVELPHNRDMRGYVTQKGEKMIFLGNDWCSLRQLYFTSKEHVTYNTQINYGNYFALEYGIDFPTDISSENSKVLGIHSYTPDAFLIKDHTNGENIDGRIYIKESYIYNKKEVDAPYLVYNVEPNSPFYMGVGLSSAVGRIRDMASARMRLYVSETGNEGSWKEFTNYTYVENATNSFSGYYADNLGAKTKFVMIVFPINGDLTLNDKVDSAGISGSNYFSIRNISTNIVDFDPSWETNTGDFIITYPNKELQTVVPGEVIVVPFNWLYVIIPVAALVVLAGAALVVILIIKKKKKANQ